MSKRIQSFEALEDKNVREVVEEQQQATQEFMAAYVHLLQQMGGDDMVKQMKQEVNWLIAQGAELAEALSIHYERFKKQWLQ